MSKSKKTKAPITDLLRQTILDRDIPLLVLERETGVRRASLRRFLRGEQSIRLDMADRLASYFGLELVNRQATNARHRA